MPQSALIIGATGATGKNLLRELLASPDFIRVGEVGRRLTEQHGFPAESRAKLEQKKVDFERIDEAGLKEGRWDVVFITLGTSKTKTGSAEAWKRIDHDYVVNAAEAAKSDDPTHHQRLIYLSAAGARPDAHFLYTKGKGQTEVDLAALRYSDVIMFRPSVIANAEREERKLMETFFSAAIKPLSLFTSGLAVDVGILAKAMCTAGKIGTKKLDNNIGAKRIGPVDAPFTMISNSGAVALGRK